MTTSERDALRTLLDDLIAHRRSLEAQRDAEDMPGGDKARLAIVEELTERLEPQIAALRAALAAPREGGGARQLRMGLDLAIETLTSDQPETESSVIRDPSELTADELGEAVTALIEVRRALATPTREPREPSVQDAIDKVLEGFEVGVFVRAMRADSDPAWAIKLFPYLRALATLQREAADAVRPEGRET